MGKELANSCSNVWYTTKNFKQKGVQFEREFRYKSMGNYQTEYTKQKMRRSKKYKNINNNQTSINNKVKKNATILAKDEKMEKHENNFEKDTVKKEEITDTYDDTELSDI
ncbi:hypothetical protein RFI_32569 [Reticulomyxa filosa]|uniref:Uncharacterized protein n=1 Tax=Reticulomyxa filosa TaxID=46433 RepID=X6LUM0_RETFI|nr:hypothetical protein RFI_32569 [Reticulomyxa filosa]|eukprot:ETO04827.1 hypothetical protein RFI_32569 [Reticulomyxa filosa]